MGFTDAVVGIAKAVNAINGRGRIERCCEQLGWSIDDRKGNRITLDFKCPLVGKRPLFILNGDEPLVLFSAYSLTIFDSRRVPDKVTSFALWQSSESAMGKWQISLSDDEDELFFILSYNALGAGLDAAAMKYICGGMANTASEVDAKMKREGYLR